MADGRASGVLTHDAIGLGLLIETKRLDHGADVLVGVEQLFAARVEGREAGGKLAAVLQIEEQARHEPRSLFGSLKWG